MQTNFKFFFDNGRKLLLFLKRLLNLLKIFLSHLPEDIIKLAGTITLIRDITLDYSNFQIITLVGVTGWLFTHILYLVPILGFHSISIIEIFWLLVQRNQQPCLISWISSMNVNSCNVLRGSLRAKKHQSSCGDNYNNFLT